MNNKEIEEITSTDYKIKNYVEKNNKDIENFNIAWTSEAIPKIIKIYNNKVLGGQNWIGILEKNLPKVLEGSKTQLFKWYIILLLLSFLIFLSWYKEGKN